ncbi:MAG: biosynthetic arginine decarboxylase [Planctomycetes bacterium]|jgi:arginine decarboxylase|nr:biosynthetic arginine decarboxylase [Planctomycetota bacterium]
MQDPTRRWSIQDALETYGIPYWGKGYFGVNRKGHITVLPHRSEKPAIDVMELVAELEEQHDVYPPILFRFTNILEHRMKELAGAFRKAIDENHYRGGYFAVYPVKVNQQRQVVEEVCEFGAPLGFGLEAGSKPELLAVLAMTSDYDMPIICNGFKDEEYIEMVILAQKLGRRIIPVVEKYGELELIVKQAKAHKVRPTLGVRVKLSARGSGRWELSGGLRSKFGLFVPEVLNALDYLKKKEMADCLKLVHFHLGSQITNIQNLKNAVNELARVYVDLKKEGAGLELIDVGGGLGVDYDGSQTNFPSSMNYTMEEYASDIVYRVMSICDEAGVDHPTIVSESGRAMVAHHALLVFDVLGMVRFDQFEAPETIEPIAPAESVPQPLLDLHERLAQMNRRNCIEYFHDAQQAYEEAMTAFNLGYMNLRQRAIAERCFWALCRKVEKLSHAFHHFPEELEGLSGFLADSYVCNFSIFQSLPDSWAIDQLFPIVPMHRLDERPTRRGILVDVTCDSDGKINEFSHPREEKRTLELHELNGRPYYLGVFLAGAYQEILGDLHNLFGDTHAVHVSVDEDGKTQIRDLVLGDTVAEVLSYVQFSPDQLRQKMRREVERAVRRKLLKRKESDRLMRFYSSGLKGYTYLEEIEPQRKEGKR